MSSRNRQIVSRLTRTSSAATLAAAVVFFLASTLSSAPADAELKFVETKDLRVLYYDPEETPLVAHATQSLLASLEGHRRLFGYVPTEKINVLLQDFADRSNALASVSPHNRIFIDVAPQSDPYEYLPQGDTFRALSAHENMHVVTLEKPSPEDAFYRQLFHGKVDVDSRHPESLLYYYLTTPRNTAPRWYPEGSAVFTETWMSGGVGRALGGYDEMVFRAMVKEGARFYDPLGLVSKGTEVDFRAGGNAYLYGTRFMSYLALTYDPQHVLAWWRRDVATRRYYATDFERVFGLPLERAWQDWQLWEKTFQSENLQTVRRHPITAMQDITHEALGAATRTLLSSDGTTLYAAVKRPGKVSSLISIDRNSGTVTRLHELKGPFGLKVTSLALDGATATLFYTSNNENHRNLEAFDLKSRKSRVLLPAARIGDIAFNAADRSLWGIRFNNGFGMIVRIPFPYSQWKVVHVFRKNEKAFDLDVSPDGQFLSVSVSSPGNSSLKYHTEVKVMRTRLLEKDDPTPYRTFALEGAVPEGFVFSNDGRYLFGSSYYAGVSNIYRYEIERDSIEAVSNAEVGLFAPTPVDNAHLIALRFATTGFVPTLIEANPTDEMSAISFLGEQISKRHPEVLSWAMPPTATIPFEANVTRRGTYRPLRELALQSAIPMVQGYKDSAAVGFSAQFADPMGFDSVLVDASYSPDRALPAKERAHIEIDFHHSQWTLGAKWNAADFYDLFGPTKRSRAGYSGYVSYDRPLVYDPPETLDVVANVAYFGGLDALPGFQNVPSPSRNLSTIDVGLVSKFVRSSPGAVDSEAGHMWSIMAHTYGAAGAITPSLQLQYDVGLALPIDHSSLWLRTAAVISEGHAGAPLANAYLGGFGNNYVDNSVNGDAQRYRSLLSMPGFGIDSLHGRNLAKAMVEWSLPPIRFEAIGTPGFYLSWARPEIFASFLATNADNPAQRQSAGNIGAQMDFKLTVMHRLPAMLSLGVARGFGARGQGNSEFMLSLQVL